MEEYRSGKKSLEIACYIGGAGAFGVFLRWLQLQLAFNELGLPDQSLFHALSFCSVVGAAAGSFSGLVHRFEKQRLYLPDEFSGGLLQPGALYRIARIALRPGRLRGRGAALHADGDGPEQHGLSVSSPFSACSWDRLPALAGFANRKPQPAPGVLCVLASFPMLFLAAWMVICYKVNTINSVIWSYAPELVAVAASMFAFFRLGGYAFGRPRWKD